MFRKALVCAAVSVVLGSSAQAGLVSTTASNDFWFTDDWGTFKNATAVPAVRTTNDLNGLFEPGPNGDPVENNTAIGGIAVPGIGTLSGTGTLYNSDPNNTGRHAVDENGNPIAGFYIEGSTLPNSFEINFTSAVHAFAFWGTDIGDFSSTCQANCDGVDGSSSAAVFSVQLFSGGISRGVFQMSGTATDGSADFYGLLSKDISFDRAVIANLTTVDGQGFSRFTVSTDASDPPGGNNDVPEPGVLALVGVGLLGLRRWRKA